MKKIFLILLVIIFAPLNAFSFTELQTGKVIGYFPHQAGGNKVFFLKIENNVVGTCNTSGRFALSSTHVNYDAFVATIMTAYHSKEIVKIKYNETCNTFSNSYDLYLVCVGDISC